MKKVGQITESRRAQPSEPKYYPLVSDDLFEGKVKLKGRKKIKEGDLPMNQRPRITQAGRAPKVDPSTYQTYNSMTDAKDPNWIQGAEKDIERRGTEGKCTPITKPGCTGKAKALAKTFKKMAKKRDKSIKTKNETIGGCYSTRSYWSPFGAQNEVFPSNPTAGPDGLPGIGSGPDPNAAAKKSKAKTDDERDAEEDAIRSGAAQRDKHPSNQPSGGNKKVESTTAKPIRQARARAQAGKPIKKGTAKMVASDPGQDLDTAKKAGAKL